MKTEGERRRERALCLPFFFKTTRPIRLGSHLTTPFNLNYPLKAMSPNTVTLGIRTSIYEFVKSVNSTYDPAIPLWGMFGKN